MGSWIRGQNRHGTPNAVILLGGLLAVFGTLIGLVAFLAPADFAAGFSDVIADADAADELEITGLARSWGARNAALGLGMGAAVLLGRRPVLFAAFVAATGREAGDTINGLIESDGTAPIAIAVLILDVLVLWTLRGVVTDRTNPNPAGTETP